MTFGIVSRSTFAEVLCTGRLINGLMKRFFRYFGSNTDGGEQALEFSQPSNSPLLWWPRHPVTIPQPDAAVSPHTTTVLSPLLSHATQEEAPMESAVMDRGPATLKSSAPSGGLIEYSGAQDQEGRSFFLSPQTPANRQVGSRAGTNNSLRQRKSPAKYHCNVDGCESKGFTARHNYECEWKRV